MSNPLLISRIEIGPVDYSLWIETQLEGPQGRVPVWFLISADRITDADGTDATNLLKWYDVAQLLPGAVIPMGLDYFLDIWTGNAILVNLPILQ